MIRLFISSLKKKRILKKKNTIAKMRFVPNDLIVGENCILGKKSILSNNVKIGNYTYLNSNIKEVIVESNTEIGNFCSIAPGVCIGLGNHYLDLVSTHPFLFNQYYKNSIAKDITLKRNGLIDEDQSTKIESDVWIGANAIINRGITVGQGAVIASGAIVTKNVEPYSIIAGIPGKKIGTRFDNTIVKKLLENKEYSFWYWEKEELASNFELMYDIEAYTNYLDKKSKK